MHKPKSNPDGPKVFGLTGTHGAGKGMLVSFLKQCGFAHFSARDDVLWPEVRRRGLPDNTRDSLSIVANKLREENGAEYVAFRLYELARSTGRDAVIESIYTLGEISRIREAAEGRFILIAIDADIRIRYDRITKNRRGETDMISYEKFFEQQSRELYSADPTKHNLLACWDAADIKLLNNGTVDELRDKLREKLKKSVPLVPGLT